MLRSVRQCRLFKEIDRTLRREVYEYLTFLWNTAQFIPCPVKMVATRFGITPTHVLYLVLAWQESRTRDELYAGTPLPTEGD